MKEITKLFCQDSFSPAPNFNPRLSVYEPTVLPLKSNVMHDDENDDDDDFDNIYFQ
jgi:hypothetical protein